jgi:Ca-activated chloride channel family protein
MRYLLTACFCSLFLLFAFRSPVQFVVTGKITDASGAPIPFVSISVKGTANGTTTNPDGTFQLTINSGKAILIISMVGFESKEIEVTPARPTIAISLIASKKDLSEVVVTRSVKRKISFGFSNNNKKSEELYLSPGYLDQNSYGLAKDGNSPRGTISDSTSYHDGFDREGYDAIIENRFLKATDNPLSTFSIDVDAASYSNVRRMLNMGKLPPAGAVRIEEMINYFKYEYPQPKGEDPFSINTEMADCPWNNKHKLVLIGLQGKKIETDKLPPSNMVFLIDVSGSMNEPNKLPLVKQSVKLLADQLRDQDKVAIVVYAGNAGLVLPSTSGENNMDIKDAIDKLEAGGSTAGGAGIKLAYKIAKQEFIKGGNNRVILCTDGDFNVGTSSDDELERMIEQERKSGVFLTVLGFGTGNYQDAKMQKLADKGNGNHAYIDGFNEARKVLATEFGGTLFTIAKDVKLQIEFNPTKVQAYRLIGYENRMLNKEDFNNDKKDAGELGSGHTVTALYEVIPVGVMSDFIESVDKLKYQPESKPLPTATSGELMTIKFRYKKPDEDKSKLIEHPVMDQHLSIENSSDNFRFAASVAQFGMLLRDSEFKQSSSFDNAWKLANDAIGEDEEGYRAEFLKLIRNARSLARNNTSTKKKDLSKH